MLQVSKVYIIALTFLLELPLVETVKGTLFEEGEKE
jgi:hypothetical protein